MAKGPESIPRLDEISIDPTVLIFAVGISVLAGLLLGVGPLDPVTYGGVSIVLGAVALLSCYLPARRVSSVAPVETLRWE